MGARVFALGAALGLLACGPDDGATSDEPAENLITTALRVLPPDEEFAGKDLEQWAVEFMHWHYSWTSGQCLNAEDDRDGSRCGFNQPKDSPVFFFASCEFARTPEPVVERTLCKVPAGKAIMVPIGFVGDDNGGLDEDEVVVRTPEVLEENVDELHETMRDLTLIADQRPVEDLSRYSIGPKAIEVSVGEAPNRYTCAGFDVENTTVSPSYFAGYFALVAPPSAGKHRLEYSSVYSYFGRNNYYRVSSLFEVTEGQ
jgi:hypothetical protein